MALEQVFPSSALGVGGGRIITTPFQFVSDADTFLRVTSVCSVAGVVLAIQGRRLDSRGQIAPITETHTPLASRTKFTQDYVLGVGALLNLTVFATAGTPLAGQCYVIVQLLRNTGTTAIVLGTLLGGVVTTTQALGFPGSPVVSSLEGEPAVRTITGTRPAAGGALSETVPPGARWELQALAAQFVADANPATRATYLTFGTGGVPIGSTWNPHSTTAGGSTVLSWLQGVQLQDPFPTGGGGTGPLPSLRLLAGHNFSTFTINEQVGDQWGFPFYTVREWLEAP